MAGFVLNPILGAYFSLTVGALSLSMNRLHKDEVVAAALTGKRIKITITDLKNVSQRTSYSVNTEFTIVD